MLTQKKKHERRDEGSVKRQTNKQTSSWKRSCRETVLKMKMKTKEWVPVSVLLWTFCVWSSINGDVTAVDAAVALQQQSLGDLDNDDGNRHGSASSDASGMNPLEQQAKMYEARIQELSDSIVTLEDFITDAQVSKKDECMIANVKVIEQQRHLSVCVCVCVCVCCYCSYHLLYAIITCSLAFPPLLSLSRSFVRSFVHNTMNQI